MNDKKSATKKKDLCSRCEIRPKNPLHSCPFNEDINNDSKTLCNCCNSCARECAMDI